MFLRPSLGKERISIIYALQSPATTAVQAPRRLELPRKSRDLLCLQQALDAVSVPVYRDQRRCVSDCTAYLKIERSLYQKRAASRNVGA